MDKYTDMDFKISIITNKSTENILSYPELINQCAHSYFYHQYTQTIRYNFLSHPSILGIALPARKQPFIIGIITGYNIIISMFPYFYLFFLVRTDALQHNNAWEKCQPYSFFFGFFLLACGST